MEWEYKFNFDNDKYIIGNKNRNMSTIFVPMVGQRMFPINILDFFEFSIISNKIDESMIWHQMYGHLYFNAMKVLYTKNMVQGLPYIYHLKIKFVQDIFFESSIECHFHLVKFGEHKHHLN